MNEMICWIDEFRTSKCCSRCGGDQMKECLVMRHIHKTIPETEQTEVKYKPLRPWGLRVCTSSQCRQRVWDRDVNADLNMIRRTGNYLNQRGRDKVDLDYLCRKQRDHDEVDDHAAVKVVDLIRWSNYQIC